MLYDIYVCGMRVEHYVGEGPGAESFEMEPCECVEERLFCITASGRIKFFLNIINEFGWCGSGYTTASWAYYSKEDTYDFGPATHLPKDHKPIKISNLQYDAETGELVDSYTDKNDDQDMYDVNQDYTVFTYSDWGDEYYPGASCDVNYDLFIELPRAIKKRPVWIFVGESGTGKSTIASILQDKIIYETDSANNGILPDEIWADVIVLGNKWKDKFGVSDVVSKIKDDVEIITVEFNKYEKEDVNEGI